MIKGKVILQRDSIKKSTANYREIDALNCSMIKLFDTDPVKFFEFFKLGKKKKETKNTSLIIGDLVDFYLLDCKGDEEEFEKRFDEKFALFEDNKGSGQVFLLADTLFEVTNENTDDNGVVTASFDTMFSEAFRRVQAQGKYGKKEESKALEDFNENALTYYESLVENIGKIVVDLSLMEKAKVVAKNIFEDDFTQDLFHEDETMENFPKFIIEWEYSNPLGRYIKCKSELDLIKIDHKYKVIYPKDLKTTYDNENFEYGYLKYRYDLQAAFYTLAVRNWSNSEGMSSYTIAPFEFIVGDTSSNNRRPVRYQLTEQDIQAGLDGFKLRGVEYKGVRTIINEILWAEDSGNWNVSADVFKNKGILKLNLKYD